MNIQNKPTLPAQHTLLQSFLLHVLPGALATITFIVIKPKLDPLGYPPLLAFLLAILLIDVPIMLVVLFYEGKKLNGEYSLSGIVTYCEKTPWGVFALIFIGAFILVFVLITLITPINTFVTEKLFSGLPKWIYLEEQSQYLVYAKNLLILTFTFQLVLTGIVLPWLEELYFRGYLLPRISRYGLWTPWISGLFFGLYHVWQPFGFLTVFVLGVVLSFITRWKRDLRLSISLHVFANAITRLAFLLAALSI